MGGIVHIHIRKSRNLVGILAAKIHMGKLTMALKVDAMGKGASTREALKQMIRSIMNMRALNIPRDISTVLDAPFDRKASSPVRTL